MKLNVGTESTWSLRAWMCGQLAKQSLTVQVVDLSHKNYKTEIFKYSNTGLVPVLIDNKVHVHDSLAIMEYLNEYSLGAILPSCAAERALARSLCAELHSGFSRIRTKCPFSSEPVELIHDVSDIQVELTRLETIFSAAQLPFMFKEASAVDVFYAVLAYRLKSYGIYLSGKAGDYQDSLTHWSLMCKAIERAKSWRLSVR